MGSCAARRPPRGAAFRPCACTTPASLHTQHTSTSAWPRDLLRQHQAERTGTFDEQGLELDVARRGAASHQLHVLLRQLEGLRVARDQNSGTDPTPGASATDRLLKTAGQWVAEEIAEI